MYIGCFCVLLKYGINVCCLWILGMDIVCFVDVIVLGGFRVDVVCVLIFVVWCVFYCIVCGRWWSVDDDVDIDVCVVIVCVSLVCVVFCGCGCVCVVCKGCWYCVIVII